MFIYEAAGRDALRSGDRERSGVFWPGAGASVLRPTNVARTSLMPARQSRGGQYAPRICRCEGKKRLHCSDPFTEHDGASCLCPKSHVIDSWPRHHRETVHSSPMHLFGPLPEASEPSTGFIHVHSMRLIFHEVWCGPHGLPSVQVWASQGLTPRAWGSLTSA